MDLLAVPLGVPLALYVPFYAGLLAHVLPHASRLFSRRHARMHRLVGLAYLLWIAVGLGQLCMGAHNALLDPSAYDLVLGALGVWLTLSAAFGFGHRNVRNEASGALDEQATITHGEMIEHAFYQGLNVAQACFLHAMRAEPTLPVRMALLVAVTLPWAFRSRFPVNHFSDNFRGKPHSLVRLLYRLKKYQYMLYKHALLHGLNISVAFSGHSFAAKDWWRFYWISLNTAYVLEFFLQTLVKKGFMRQGTMLVLNQLLMVITTLPVLQVFKEVYLLTAAISLALNMINRGWDMPNTALTAALTSAGLALLPP